MELVENYRNSIFDLGISPEYNIGEVSLAALYRQVGWKKVENGKGSRFSEAKVNEEAKVFFNELSKGRHKNGDLLSFKDWKQVVELSLTTPKMTSQAKSKYPILYPYVPDCTLYSSAARLRGQPWNPGNLIEKILLLGSGSQDRANELWEKLFTALSSKEDNNQEDFLARLITRQFNQRRPEGIKWELNPLSQQVNLIDGEVIQNSPAAIFVQDLEKIIALKYQLTRRQWLSILESNIRISCAAHILWICNLNSLVWSFFKSSLLLEEIEEEDLFQKLKIEASALWKVEEKAVPLIKEQVQKYIRSQISINFLLKRLLKENENISLNNVSDIFKIGKIIQERIKDGQWKKSILSEIHEVSESNTRLLNCKGGISKNIFEFLRYSLGQKQTADPHKKNHDQAYWLRKKGDYSSAPWIVDLGPASILTMVYCCSYGHDQNRTIIDLLEHLGRYGIIINQKDLESSNLFNTLSTLQVVSDSPDAEGGMVILNPFKK